MRFVKSMAAIVFATTYSLSSYSLGAVTTYSSRVEWAAVVRDYQTEDFEILADLSEIPLDGGVFSSQHFDILVDANHGRIGPASDGFFRFLRTPGLSGTFFVGDVHAPTSSRPHFNTIQFSKPIIAFAANFAALDDGGLRDIRIGAESFQVLGSNVDGQYRSVFLGVVSTAPFLTVDIRNSEGVLERYGMDDVSFKSVAEPGAGSLLLLCLAAIILRTISRQSDSVT